jgi:fumiquinazoline A oxidase
MRYLTYSLVPNTAVGTAHCVGVLGATMGGGVSAGQGIMGLLADLLDSAQVVTANGSTVTASRVVNTDLFWALRGAGANFGIVTSATYRLPQLVSDGQVINANFLFPASMSLSVFNTLALFDNTLNSKLAFNVAAFYNPEADQVNHTISKTASITYCGRFLSTSLNGNSQVVLMVNANYYGRLSDAEEELKPFLALNPLQHELLVVPWPRVFETSYFGVDDKKACSRAQHVNMYSVSAVKTDPEAMSSFIDQLLAFSRLHPDVATTFVVHRFPTDAVTKFADSESAYPYRNNKMHM